MAMLICWRNYGVVLSFVIEMDGCFSPKDLQVLQNLICPPRNDSDVEDDLPQAGARKLGEFMFTIG